jgi:MarR family transcriptional regulator, organic hydroperoxide resistance regulator
VLSNPPRPGPRARTSGLSTEAQRLLDLLQALGSTTFRQVLWQRASELDLTFAQSQVLSYVGDHPRCPMGDVAKAFGVTLPAITHIVDRLEEKAFVARGSSPGDRRVYALTLTATGRSLVDELHTIRTRAMCQVLTRMSLSDRRRLLTGLEALVAAAHAAGENSE